MASKYFGMSKKLQRAINDKFDLKLLINANQWYSEQRKAPISVYTVKLIMNNEKHKNTSVELFKTYSTVQLALFMRDYWYELNGWDVPKDNEMWEEIKARYGQNKTPTDTNPTVPGRKCDEEDNGEHPSYSV